MPGSVTPFVKPTDPREQAVQPDEAPVYLDRPGGISEPIRAQIERTDVDLALAEPRCTACWELTELHFQPNPQRTWIGCEGAIQRALLQKQTGSQRIPHDAPWTVVGAMQSALQTACGAAVYELYRTLGPQEQIEIARTLASVAIRALRTSEGYQTTERGQPR